MVSYFSVDSWQQVYRQKLIEHLSLHSEERPSRIMVFRGSPKSSRKSIRFVDEMRQEEAAMLDTDGKKTHYRCIPKVLLPCFCILDFCEYKKIYPLNNTRNRIDSDKLGKSK